jgi:hypothetical protein
MRPTSSTRHSLMILDLSLLSGIKSKITTTLHVPESKWSPSSDMSKITTDDSVPARTGLVAIER